ncbi:hypothetical protein [Holospora elegans]|nr:hypothetical protein [Holospora elegans]
MDLEKLKERVKENEDITLKKAAQEFRVQSVLVKNN